ncbi:hypothetical protein DL96DRAFT_1602794 [Flagelloscypha sp. PMI_526]|nr:hypothetical protein DL96DRAFT_1602794 [Flagelloscypha sp. PMI_526]
MVVSVQFELDDTSPLVAYAPIADTFASPDLSQAWNPYYNISGFAQSAGQTGEGTSLHITSLNNAGLSFPFFGYFLETLPAVQAIALSVDNTPVQASSSNTDGALATVENLSNDQHVISLTVSTTGAPNSFVVFDRAIIDTVVNSTDSPPQTPFPPLNVSWMGHWSDALQMKTSPEQGDALQLQFQGLSISVYGTTSPNASTYNVTLDGVSTTGLDARSSFSQTDTLLFHRSGLDPLSNHTFRLSNSGEGSLTVNPNRIFIGTIKESNSNSTQAQPDASSNAPKSYPTGTIAALVLAGVLAFLILSVFLFYVCVYRPRRRKRQELEAGVPVNSEEAKANATVVPNFHPAPSQRTQSTSTKSSSSWRWRERRRRQVVSEQSITVDLPPRNRPLTLLSMLPDHNHSHPAQPSSDGSLEYVSSLSTRPNSQLPPNRASILAPPQSALSRPMSKYGDNDYLLPPSSDPKGKRASRNSIDQLAVRSLSPQLSSAYARDLAAQKLVVPLWRKRRRLRGNLSHMLLPKYLRKPSHNKLQGRLDYHPFIPKGTEGREYLSLRLENTPFTHDFAPADEAQKDNPRRRSTRSDGSRVRFEDEEEEQEDSQDLQIQPPLSSPRPLPQVPTHPPPAPPTVQPPTPAAVSIPNHPGESSFLDFDSSSRSSSSGPGSLMSRPSREPKSRWSATTGGTQGDASSATGSGYGSLLSSKPSMASLQPPPSEASSFFPFPISTSPASASPPNPDSQFNPQPLPTQTVDGMPVESTSFQPPSMFSSDAETVPRSISDAEFHHSDSEERNHRASLSLPSHPPLPPTPQSSSFVATNMQSTERIVSSPRTPHFQSDSL